MNSAIYEGWVRHRRTSPVEHAFTYRVFLLYLDLAELDRAFRGRWLWSVDRPNVVSFRRRDYHGDPARGVVPGGTTLPYDLWRRFEAARHRHTSR